MKVDAVYIISHRASVRLPSALTTAEFLIAQFGGEVKVLRDQPTFCASRAPTVVLRTQKMLRKYMENRVSSSIHAESSRCGAFVRVPVSRHSGRIDLMHQKKVFVEKVLYEKHVQAWQLALSNRCRGFIVMEDDAIMKLESADIAESLGALAASEFLDLAGGFDVTDLEKFVHIDWDVDGTIWRSTPAVTNTLCAYWISADFARKLLPVLSQRLVKLLPIDWALNLAFSRVAGDVSHVFPTLLSHGSMTGDFRSDIR